MRYMTARVSTRDGGPTAQFRFRRLIVNYVVFISSPVGLAATAFLPYWSSTVPTRLLALPDGHAGPSVTSYPS